MTRTRTISAIGRRRRISQVSYRRRPAARTRPSRSIVDAGLPKVLRIQLQSPVWPQFLSSVKLIPTIAAEWRALFNRPRVRSTAPLVVRQNIEAAHAVTRAESRQHLVRTETTTSQLKPTAGIEVMHYRLPKSRRTRAVMPFTTSYGGLGKATERRLLSMGISPMMLRDRPVEPVAGAAFDRDEMLAQFKEEVLVELRSLLEESR